MSDLKRQLIKIGSANPELRPHIREILNAAESVTASKHRSIERKINDVRSDIASAIRKTDDDDEVMKLEFADSLLGDATDSIRFI